MRWRERRNNDYEKETWQIIEEKTRINPILKVLGVVAVISFGLTALSIKESPRPYWQLIRTGIWFTVLCLIIAFLYSGYSYHIYSKLKDGLSRLVKKLNEISRK